MKTQKILITTILSALALPAFASDINWSCTVADIADGGAFETTNQFSFQDHPEVTVAGSEDNYSASIGALSFGGETETAVSEIAGGKNTQTFVAYSDYNEDEFTPIAYIEVFNPSAKRTIGTVRYRDSDTDEIRLLGSFNCVR